MAIVGAGCAALAVAFPPSAFPTGSRSGSRGPAVPGNAQSPINLRKNEITFVSHLPHIVFSYPSNTAVTLVNTGSPDEFATVRADVPTSTAFITVGGARYELVQFHWHTPSEHEIESKDTPMEMHLVHQGADGAFLVLGVFIVQGPANSVIEPIFRELPKQAGDTRAVSVQLGDLLPDRRESFRYSGSLTTPPFTEGVGWIVLATPITLSKQQIGAFQELFEDGNSREVQPLNDRKVLSDARGSFGRG